VSARAPLKKLRDFKGKLRDFKGKKKYYRGLNVSLRSLWKDFQGSI